MELELNICQGQRGRQTVQEKKKWPQQPRTDLNEWIWFFNKLLSVFFHFSCFHISAAQNDLPSVITSLQQSANNRTKSDNENENNAGAETLLCPYYW